MGPAPVMRTVWPGCNRPRSTPYAATAAGSMSAAWRGVIVAVTGTTWEADTIASPARPPQALLSPVQAIVRHRCPCPRRHSWHWPQ